MRVGAAGVIESVAERCCWWGDGCGGEDKGNDCERGRDSANDSDDDGNDNDKDKDKDKDDDKDTDVGRGELLAISGLGAFVW